MNKTKEQKILVAIDLLRKMSSRKVDAVNFFSLGLIASESNFEETHEYMKEESQ